MGHRNSCFFGKYAKLAGGYSADDPITGQKDGPFRLFDQSSSCLQRFPIGGRSAYRNYREGFACDLLPCYILWRFDVTGPRFLGLCNFEGLSDNLRNQTGLLYAGIPLRDRTKHPDDIDILMGLLVDPIHASLTCNGHEGGSVQIGIRDAGDQICRTWTQGRKTDTRSSSQSAVNICHEGRTLFMPGGYKFDAAGNQRVQD